MSGGTTRCVYGLPREVEALDQLPSNKDRSSAVHNLVEAFGLLKKNQRNGSRFIIKPDHLTAQIDNPKEFQPINTATVLRTKLASRADLEEFHDPEYVDSLLKGYDRAENDDDEEEDRTSLDDDDDDSYAGSAIDRKLERFGLEHDCPPFPQMAKYVLAVAGAAREISQELREDRADIGIVWDGGRHHAQPSSAAGFCYVNDIALAISELRRPPRDKTCKKFDRILYLDMFDIHHGDAVELAYWSTSKVLTLSVHLHDPEGGFYPLSGSVKSSGPAPPSPAASHALNVPINHPGSLGSVCRRVILPLISAYKPSALVIQCGVDGLAGDPVGGRLWGLGLRELGDCLEAVIQQSLVLGHKILLLGGGGYHTPNVARAWAYFTSIALGRRLSLDTEIPLDVKNEVAYGPTYTLDVPQLEKPGSKNADGEDGREGGMTGCDEKLNEVLMEIEHHLSVIKNKYSNC